MPAVYCPLAALRPFPAIASAAARAQQRTEA
jgi:hypothetical protein